MSRWLAGGCLTLVVALFTGWWLFVRAPSPAAVCEHIIAVTMRESAARDLSMDAEAPLIERLRVRCIQHKVDKIQLRGRIKYARYAACVMSHDDVSAIDAC